MPAQMNVDHYSKGKSELNRDYALSGLSPFPFVIVADGCSSTKYSEVGALILAHAARNILGRYSEQVISSYEAFGKAVLAQAESVANMLGRPKEILDATLVMAWIDREHIKFRMYGDGMFLLKTSYDSIIIHKHEFDKNMPYYLSYRTDSNRLNEYREQVKQGHLEITTIGNSAVHQEDYGFDTPLEWILPMDRVCAFAVASDGFSQLFVENNSEFVALPKVIEEVFALKSVAGSFITKRMRRMLSDYESQGIKQLDDISVGMVCL